MASHRQELLERFERLNVWSRGSERAPHKPLLVLHALARLSHGQESVPFTSVDEVVGALLREFGPPRKSYHPEYPFWRLQNDGLWEIPDAARFARRTGHSDARKSELLRHEAVGQFPTDVLVALRSDPSLIHDIAHALLAQHFPESMHDDILSAVGLSIDMPRVTRRRDPEFRGKVITAYEHGCAICGFSVSLGNADLGLEAAHVKWHQAGGPDTQDNGLALCVMHHKMLDRGAVTVREDYEVVVSEQVHGSNGFEEWLLAFHGHPLRRPQRAEYLPAEKFLKWHWREVFRGPARE
ncbi:phosphorothioated DNA-binding restriction endonuclease [Candidatus Latescibacterota bacterium]